MQCVVDGNVVMFRIPVNKYGVADKSLARPGRKQATATQTLTFASHLKKKFRILSVQPGLSGSNDLRVGRKMVKFQSLFFQLGRAKDLSAPLYNIVILEFNSLL